MTDDRITQTRAKGRRYKVAASWHSKKMGGKVQYFQDEMGDGMRLREALRLWFHFLLRYQVIAKITRKQPQRFYFSEPFTLDNMPSTIWGGGLEDE